MAKAGQELSMPMVPGVSCASDIMLGLEFGYSAFKFFRRVLGRHFSSESLAAPFSQVTFCPTGGIGPHNLVDYLSLECVSCVGGSWLTPVALQRRNAWSEVTELTQQAVNTINS